MIDSLADLSPQDAERAIYQEIVSRNPEHDFEPTLDRVREACTLLGDPQHAYKVIHLTGTNGKTSTARMTESLVREHGLRTGLFTSPHLTSVRERIQIDGEPISRNAFIELWQTVAPIIELVDQRSLENAGPRLSFFEVLTVLAFAAFADAPVDVAIVEVGMGGEWDATNVVDADVAVITPIGLDHAQWLGDTIRDIAIEKSGIIKAGSVAVIAEQTDSASEVLRDRIFEFGATGVWEGDHIEVASRLPGVGGQLTSLRAQAAVYTDVFVPLYGEYQAHNALLALTAVEALLADGGQPAALDGATVEAGFAAASSPGRLEVVRSSPMIVVDAAHNPHGVEALRDALEENFNFTRIVGVVGVLADKDSEGMLSLLEPFLDEVVITQSSSPRAVPADELAEEAREVFGEDRVRVEASLPDAIDEATAIAEFGGEVGGGVLVVGSVTLVADARILLGADRPRRDGGKA